MNTTSAQVIVVAVMLAGANFLGRPLPLKAQECTGKACQCGKCSRTCQHCGAACPRGELVAKTVMVPENVAELRSQTRVIYVTKQREETYTVFERVPETRKFIREQCYLEHEVKTQEITEKKCHIVRNPVVSTYTVMVPDEVECRQGVIKKEVCGLCGKRCVEEPCSCEVVRLRPEVRSRTYEEMDVVVETNTKTIDYCVKTPKKQTEVCTEETVYKLQPVTKTRTVEVCVPEVIKEPVEVIVCKNVPMTVLCCQKCATSCCQH